MIQPWGMGENIFLNFQLFHLDTLRVYSMYVLYTTVCTVHSATFCLESGPSSPSSPLKIYDVQQLHILGCLASHTGTLKLVGDWSLNRLKIPPMRWLARIGIGLLWSIAASPTLSTSSYLSSTCYIGSSVAVFVILCMRNGSAASDPPAWVSVVSEQPAASKVKDLWYVLMQVSLCIVAQRHHTVT